MVTQWLPSIRIPYFSKQTGNTASATLPTTTLTGDAPTDNLELTSTSKGKGARVHRENSAEESARARQNLQEFATQLKQHTISRHFSVPAKIKETSKPPTSSFPVDFNRNSANSASHAYFQLPEHSRAHLEQPQHPEHLSSTENADILRQMNEMIDADPKLKQKLESSLPANFRMQVFDTPKKSLKHLSSSIPEYTLPVQFNRNTANAKAHAYLTSTKAEHQEVLDGLNKLINGNAKLRKQLDASLPSHFAMPIFDTPKKSLNALHQHLKDTAIPEFTLPVSYAPNAANSASHTYLYSSNPEFAEVLGALNKRIHRDPELKAQLENTPRSNFTMRVFGLPSKSVDTLYQDMKDTYGPGLFSRLDQALEYGVDGFREKSTKRESPFFSNKTGGAKMVEANTSPAARLNSLLGQEFSFVPNAADTSVAPELQKLLRENLGFAENQMHYPGSQISKDLPEDQKIISNWRVKTAARFMKNKATHIATTWGEWWSSVKISTAWSLGGETLLNNTWTSIGPGAIFSKPIAAMKQAGEAVPPTWRRLLLGIPDDLQKKSLGEINGGRKFALVLGGTATQGSAEIPDVALVKAGAKRVEDPTLTRKEALVETLAEEKGSLAKSVLSATLGTMPEKAKELLWIPTSTAGKVGKWMTGYATNAVSVLSCAYPFFEDGGPQRKEIGLSSAEAFHPETGDLKLMDKQKAALEKAISGSKDGAKGVEKFFSGGAVSDMIVDAKNFFGSLTRRNPVKAETLSKFLHEVPLAKLLAASVPTAVAYSVLPSTINGAVKTFMKEGVVSEAIQSGVSMAQVPLFGPIELLSFNTVAVLNRVAPNVVTGLSKVGRPVIEGVHSTFSGAKGLITGGWRAVRGTPTPKDPQQAYFRDWHDSYKKIKQA